MRKLFRFLTSKLFIFGLLLLIQFVIIFVGVLILNEAFAYVYIVSMVLSFLLSLYILNKNINPDYKLAWIIPILCLPIWGMTTYLLLGRNNLGRIKRGKYTVAAKTLKGLLNQDESVMKAAEEEDAFFGRVASYVYKSSDFPVCECGDVEYFPIGEKYFERLLEELKNAEKFIFMEYFIIEQGVMWNAVLEILKEKVAEGVDVRIIYDDMGTLMTLPYNYYKKLRKMGIKTFLFNKFKPIINVSMNNRTHRKITVIDGKTAFTGGINLADEYINKKMRFGHWKDTGIMVKGRAALNYTVMFLQMWAYKNGVEDYSKYEYAETDEKPEEGGGYIQSFTDSPTDLKNVYENIYMQIIYNAKDYVYINTPYLVLDNEMKTALITAAQAGVDVRITVPHIPDKKSVFLLTKAFYTQLIAGGVKVYEYMPGFVHAKSIVSDDKYSVVGTSNMDFRSFYLHFECGSFILDEKTARIIREDYEETLKTCKLIDEKATRVNVITRFARGFLRIIAPLM